MRTAATDQRRYSFGEFTLDIQRGALRKGGKEIRLRRQSFEVLRYLVEHPGRLVTKEELLASVWGNTIVTDGSLTQCVIDVRRALGDGSRKIVRTLPRRGYIFEVPVGESAGTTNDSAAAPPRGRRVPGHTWPLAAGLVLLAAAITWWSQTFDSTAGTEPAARANSIAVLPFVDMSEAQDQGYLSDGIAEEILNLLAESPDLHVIARTSSFSFRDGNADIATIAEELGVAWVLQGSVRQWGNRLRITSQLVDTTSSIPVWSNTYDRELGDVLALQLEIAASVATALQVTLSIDPSSTPARPRNAEAYERYLQGRLFHNRRAPGDPQRAEAYFRQALEIDPTFGRAWAALAGALFTQVVGDAREGTLAAWREAVEQALRYAPEDPEAHMRAAQFFWSTGKRDTARQHLRKATMLGPENPLVLSAWAGSNVFHGNLEEGIALQRRVVALDPVGAVNRGNLAAMLVGAKHFEEAAAEGQRALDLNPSYRMDFERLIATIFIAQGRFAEALKMVRQWPAGEDRDTALALACHGLGQSGDADTALGNLLAGFGAGAAFGAAEVHAYRGEVDESFKWLDISLDRAHPYGREDRVRDARLSPFLHALHDDPRWEQMLMHGH